MPPTLPATPLRNLPSCDEMLNTPEIKTFDALIAQSRIKDSINAETNAIRKKVINGEYAAFSREQFRDKIVRKAVKRLKSELLEHPQKVINATGVIIHTNLGRAPLSAKAAKVSLELASSYQNLEYSAQTGQRRSRLHSITKILTDLTGAEDAIVVNNNAAAVFLALNSVCNSKDVVISCGELVEIGDGFRISDIMRLSGCNVIAVGTTNVTRESDITGALTDNTGILVKIHTSNFKVTGFTKDVTAAELVQIGHSKGVAVMEDMGSGVLFDLTNIGLKYERTVMDAVSDGVDIVTFSGDKMLGGPQAGIIVGKKIYIDMIRKNQLSRCMRADKMCLNALGATLLQYLSKETILEIPIYRQMAMDIDVVRERALRLKHAIMSCFLDALKLTIEVRKHDARFGGGALPEETIKSYALYIKSGVMSVSTMDELLRNAKTPIIGVINDDWYIMDVRTIDDMDFQYLKDIFSELS